MEKADIRKRFCQQQTWKLSNKFGKMIKQTDVPCMQNKNLNSWFYILLTEFNRVKFTKSIPTSNRRKKRQRVSHKILRKVILVWLIEDSYVQGPYDLVIIMECIKKSNVLNISADIPPYEWVYNRPAVKLTPALRRRPFAIEIRADRCWSWECSDYYWSQINS